MSLSSDDLQYLRSECEKMLRDSDEWDLKDLTKDFVLALMRRCVDTTPHKSVATDFVANYCNLFGPDEEGGMKATYKQVAELTGKTPEAVRKAYERKFGLTKY